MLFTGYFFRHLNYNFDSAFINIIFFHTHHLFHNTSLLALIYKQILEIMVFASLKQIQFVNLKTEILLFKQIILNIRIDL